MTPPDTARAFAARRIDPPVDLVSGVAAEGARSEESQAPHPRIDRPVISIERLSLWYGTVQALHEITMEIPEKRITAFIGPSGCGKSTLLRCLNRLNDLLDSVRLGGEIRFEGRSIRDASVDVNSLRRRIGMVFQRSNPFPKTIYDNVAYGPRTHGIKQRERLDEIVERSLDQAALLDEVKDRLDESALSLSGGQQQRLCIARALAVEPEIVLMDEPCSALDPIATLQIEDLVKDLKQRYTVVIVTHNMQQAARIADTTAFFFQGRLIEVGQTAQIFSRPEKKETEDYITGRFS